jgi:serine phosphatase RsbU (regulator of sigma subunit)
LGDQGNIARLYARAGRAAWLRNEPRQGLELCLEGMAIVAGAPDYYGMALLYHETGRAMYFNGDYQGALPLCEKALAIAEKWGALDVQADTLCTLGILPNVPAEQRMAYLLKSVEIAESASLIPIAGRAHLNLGTAMITQDGDYEAARAHYQRAADLAARSGATELELFYRASVVGVDLDLGNLDEVEQALPEMEKLQNSLTGSGVSELEIEMIRFSLKGFRGQLAPGAPEVRRCLETARNRGNLQFQINLTFSLASILLEQFRLGQLDSLDEADQFLQQTLEMINAGKGIGPINLIYADQAIIKAYQGKFQESHQYLEQARLLSKDEMFQKFEKRSLLAEITIARLEKRWDLALELFDKLVDYKKQMNAWEWGRVLTETAQVRLARGEPDDLEEAQAMLYEAQPLFIKMKSPVYMDEIDQLLRISRAQTHAQAQAQRLVAREMAEAGRMQGSFLPEEPPSIPGWQLAAKLVPARQTTGDYYDFIPLPDGRIGVVIADVADKGMAAALFMASSRTLLRAYATEYFDAPQEVLYHVNRRITQDTHGGLFVTSFYGILDPATGSLLYSNAGHNPPYLLMPTGEPLSLGKTGIPLGIFPDASWETRLVHIQPKTTLVLYTDGVTEAAGPKDQIYGEERLLNAINQQYQAQKPPDSTHMMSAIFSSVERFRGKTPPSDDLTLVVITRE